MAPDPADTGPNVRTVTIGGDVELRWDADRGTMSFFGISASTFWLNPSLLRLLSPLRDEIGSELFSLLVAHSSSLGTDEDYDTMVTVLGDTFEAGFLAWGRAVGAAGWGRFELPRFDRDAGEATVLIRSPWELVMQDGSEDPWGCPFLRGKMIGLFNHALGQGCWATERTFEANGEHVVEISIFPSDKTIAEELVRLRAEFASERDRKLQAEVERLAAQLQQAQKMEAIGQLTGGVAHDFNNLLTVIQGNIELVRAEVAGERGREAMKQALAATQSAATLTRRLLAFSRKQALQPQALDLRVLVSGMEGLLRRTLGETVDIESVGAAGLWRCEVDAAQLENAILNLAINARDAMPSGGTISIEVQNARLSEEYAREHDVAPGQYVLLSVTDNGVGMTAEVAEQAFEPFFTTKEIGRGSGLGLSMVHGFVNQSRGHLSVYSEVGEGTSVKIYLPRSTAPHVAPPRVEISGDRPLGHGERVLVVEDSAPVRSVSVAFLERLGYRSVDVGTAAEALAVLAEDGDVALLFTDVVLPGGMNGAELARQVQRLYPGLPILYASGYTESAIIHQGRLDPGVNLLEKPFTEAQLARRLRALLD